MNDISVQRRLRWSGIVAIAIIVVITFAQGALLAVLAIDAQAQMHTIDESGLRLAQTNEILYEAQRLKPEMNAGPSALQRAIASLESSQQQLADLSPSDSRTFEDFIAAAGTIARVPGDAGARRRLDALGPRVYDTFGRVTAAYTAHLDRQRKIDRNVALGGSLAILLAAVLTYFVALAPGASYSQTIVRKLDERRQRFAAMFDNAFDAMAIYETSGAIVRGNRAAVALLGDSAHFIGSHFSRHIAPAERSKTAAAFQRALGGTATELQTSFVDAQDRIIPVTASLTPIVVNGKVVGIVGSARDMTAQRQSEDALLLSRERFRALFDQHPSAVMAISTNGKIDQVNAAMEKLSGFSNEALIGRPSTELLPADEVASTQRRFEAVQHGETVSYESILLDKRGRRVEVEVDAIPTMVHGRSDGMFAIIKDVSRERALEARERLQRQRLGSVAQLAAAHARDVASQIDQTLAFAAASLDVDTVNVALVSGNELHMVHGAGASYEIGRSIVLADTYVRHIYGTKDLLVIEDTDAPAWRRDPARAWQPWRQVIASTLFIGGQAAGVIVFLSAEPRQSSFDEADRDFVQVVAALVGASLERERRESQLAGMASVDPLTKLPNRADLVEQLSPLLAQARRVDGCVAVHYVDLGEFKAINERFGHAAGDRMLADIAERLRGVLSEGDMLARMGGDEFIVLQSSCDREDAAHFGQRLIEAISHPIEIGGETVSISASIGIARALRDSGDATGLVRLAEQAMYRAKQSGKNRVAVHDRDSDPVP